MGDELLRRIEALEGAVFDKQESNSIGRFFKGPFVFRNWLKALLFGCLFLVIVFVAQSIYAYVRPHLPAIKSEHKSGDSTISHAGSVLQADDHSNTTRTVQNVWQPFSNGLFGAFGSQGKVQGNSAEEG